MLGHPAGDIALRTVGQALAGTIRGGDSVYRYGGEEFLILLPGQTLKTATVALERVRAAVEHLGIPHPDNPPSGVITISGGLAMASPGASNVISGQVEASLDVRHSNDGVRQRMLTQILASAREIALRLDKLNGDRQEEERTIITAIEARLESEPSLRDAYCMVIDGDGWHRGVIGLAASVRCSS